MTTSPDFLALAQRVHHNAYDRAAVVAALEYAATLIDPVGRTVSLDVSTDDASAGHRIFGTVEGVQDNTLLAVETSRNFGPEPDVVDALRELLFRAENFFAADVKFTDFTTAALAMQAARDALAVHNARTFKPSLIAVIEWLQNTPTGPIRHRTAQRDWPAWAAPLKLPDNAFGE